ncbi:MAG: hypothetical protein LBG26_04370, partial [Treponema sp.]|nr:hypothetical protein [Treponema sp.]
DWRRFLPVTGEFTVKKLAEKAKIKPVLARKTLYVLEKTGLVEKVRKEGRSWVYMPAVLSRKPPDVSV